MCVKIKQTFIYSNINENNYHTAMHNNNNWK